MNTRTTALYCFSASASEKLFPSMAVSWKFGAAAPIAGPSARAVPAAAAARATRQNARRKAFMANLSLTIPQAGECTKNSSSRCQGRRSHLPRGGWGPGPPEGGEPRLELSHSPAESVEGVRLRAMGFLDSFELLAQRVG